MAKGRPRTKPPTGAADKITELASKGYEYLSIAHYFRVHVDNLHKWLEENPELEYAYTVGIEMQRVLLHGIVIDSAKNGITSASRNAQFLLTSRFGYSSDSTATNNVNVTVANVMQVVDHGTDEEWAAKAQAQQAALVAGNTSVPAQINSTKHASLPPSYASHADTDTQPVPVPVGASKGDSAPSWDAPSWNPRA